MKFRYLGGCEAGYVKFGELVMPEGEAVEVTGPLAAKLAKNSHFEVVTDEDEPPRRGRKPKSEDGDDAG